MMSEDLDKPNLFVGKEIGNKMIMGKVVSFDENNIEMKIIKLDDEYFERYVNLGNTYPLFRHQYWNGDLFLWEVEPDSMKRQVSQILLQWKKEIGWSWDMDM
jgi:hypothetical protein